MSLTSDMWHYTVLLYHLGEQREQVDQLKFTTLAPQIQKLPEIKIVCSSTFVFIKTAVSHNPLSATNPKLTEFSLFQQTTSKLAGSEPGRIGV